MIGRRRKGRGAAGIDESRMTMDAWSMSRVKPGSAAM